MSMLIQLLWILVYIVILVGVVWVVFWAIDNIGAALPANVRMIIKAVISIIGIIVLLTFLTGGGMTLPK